MPPALGLAGLAVGLILLGSAQGWSLLHTLAYSLLLVIVLSFAWSWASVRWLYVRPRPRVLRTEVGSVLEERSEIENLSFLPRPWLEILDLADHPEHTLSQILSLAPFERRVRTLRTACRQRGEFSLGPVWLAGGDPFGLFRRERQILGPSTLVVLPRTVELQSFGNLPGELPGGSLQGERVQFTTSNVATVRDYQPGDSFNRIHWRSTARTNRLMVKEFERDPFADIWLVLDLDRLVQVGSGPDSTEEWSVTVVASLARYFLLRDRAVGVAVHGQILPTDRGSRQLLRALEFLAVTRLSRRSLDELLLAEARRFSQRDTLVVVTPTTDSRWVPICRDLALRGVRTSAALVQADSFGPAPSSSELQGALRSSLIPTYVIKHGSDIAASLALGRAA